MEILCLAIYVYWVVLFARILLSWLTMVWSPPPALDPVVRVIYDLTEPVMSLFRRYIPPIGGFDLSPIFIFIILQLISSAICG
ncbi:MAG TPA: YggT family protein [Actinomycetota bacterium]|nr:YggT family protein [Actinomycetota bacterium]